MSDLSVLHLSHSGSIDLRPEAYSSKKGLGSQKAAFGKIEDCRKRNLL
jgi:hypothetical protein